MGNPSQAKSIFAVIYRFALLPGKESDYKRLWSQVSCYFVESKGALGSTLHKANESLYVAYSRWPDRTARDAAWPPGDDLPQSVPESIKSSIIEMKACASKVWPPIEMEVIASSEENFSERGQ